MAGFLVAGGLIMNFFGISIPGMRIAGGLIVAFLGFQMLFPSPMSTRRPCQGSRSKIRHRLHAARDAGAERPGNLRRGHEPVLAGGRAPGLDSIVDFAAC